MEKLIIYCTNGLIIRERGKVGISESTHLSCFQGDKLMVWTKVFNDAMESLIGFCGPWKRDTIEPDFFAIQQYYTSVKNAENFLSCAHDLT